MKKLISALLTLSLIVLIGCGGGEKAADNGGEEAPAAEVE